jgi:hypothetical protein
MRPRSATKNLRLVLTQTWAFTLGILLFTAQAFWAGALAQQHASRLPTYRIQLAEISVQSPRSRRTDTIYAAITVEVDAAGPKTMARRLGDIGRGTKAVNMSLPLITIEPKAHARIAWAVVNYGGNRQDPLLQVLRKATESEMKGANDDTWISQLSDLVPIDDDRVQSCDGPVLAGSLNVSGAELAAQSVPGKPWRITRRQRGVDAPAKCKNRSDYFATVMIVRAPSSFASGRGSRRASE